MVDRLKLYNTRITLRLSNKEKNILKKNAYNKKITMSEYIRNLIILDNRLNSINRDLEDIKKIQNIVGRNY
ncbi:MAG: DUF6290 family protein [Bacilli bacterium]